MLPKSLFVGALQITNEFVDHIREAQENDPFLQGKVLEVMGDRGVEFEKDTTGLIRFKGSRLLKNFTFHFFSALIENWIHN